MKVAIMQPYFFPYLGYFQLINSVDRFVVLDDVHYINRGWINRNQVWQGSAPTWITMPLRKASQNRLIREIDIQPPESWQPKMSRTLEHAYPKAENQAEAMKLFKFATHCPEENLSGFLVQTLRLVCAALSIPTEIVPTSSVHPKNGKLGQERILDLCLAQKATAYLNPPGGRDLYDPGLFDQAGVSLDFQEPNLKPPGIKFSGDEGATLSILDILFLNPFERTAEMLAEARRSR